jgi:Ca-activated chloride channel homolog
MTLRKTAFLFILLAGCACALPFESDLNKGNGLYHRGQFDRAGAVYEKLDGAKSRFNLGNTLYKQAKFDESEKIFSALTFEAADKGTKEKYFYNLGNAQFKQQNYAGAVKSYEDALNLVPGDKDAQYNLELAKKMLQMPKQPKGKGEGKKDEQKQEQKQEQKKQSGMNKEDAERILQGISNEKHRTKPVKAGEGRSDLDW